MPPLRRTRQRELFDALRSTVPSVRLPADVQEQLRQALVYWLQALAAPVQAEDADERDHR